MHVQKYFQTRWNWITDTHTHTPLDWTCFPIESNFPVLARCQVRSCDGDEGSSIHRPIVRLNLSDVWNLINRYKVWIKNVAHSAKHTFVNKLIPQRWKSFHSCITTKVNPGISALPSIEYRPSTRPSCTLAVTFRGLKSVSDTPERILQTKLGRNMTGILIRNWFEILPWMKLHLCSCMTSKQLQLHGVILSMFREEHEIGNTDWVLLLLWDWTAHAVSPSFTSWVLVVMTGLMGDWNSHPHKVSSLWPSGGAVLGKNYIKRKKFAKCFRSKCFDKKGHKLDSACLLA